MIEIKGVTGVPAVKKLSRISLLVWGDAGLGKTTLAATMPGKIALILFDPDGAVSIGQHKNVDVYDFSGENTSIVSEFTITNPFKIRELCEEYDSIVFDSLTTMQDLTLSKAIEATKGATVLRPSPGAYGGRNSLLMALVRTVLTETSKTNTHIMFIAHEGPQKQNADGIVLPITLALGGQMPGTMPIRINEVWHMMKQRDNILIVVTASRGKKPMKTRMFLSNIKEFIWKYDPDMPTEDMDNARTLNNFYEKWKANDFDKIDSEQ